MKARDERRDAPGKVLKDRRALRERDRMGTSVRDDGRALKNPVSRFAASKASSPAARASDARDCGDTDTTTTIRPPLIAAARTRARNSSALCASRSTVSADVTQPLHARQSDSDTFTVGALGSP